MRKRHYLKAAFVDGDPLKSIYDLDVNRMEMIIKEGERVIRS